VRLNSLSSNTIVQKIQHRVKIYLKLQPNRRIKKLKMSKSDEQNAIFFLFQLNYYNFSKVIYLFHALYLYLNVLVFALHIFFFNFIQNIIILLIQNLFFVNLFYINFLNSI
jgi:hypothetical protein